MNSPSSPIHSASRHAFSLVELLVVIAVLSLLAVVGWGSLAGSSPGQALVAGEGASSSLFQIARSLALRHNTPVRILVNNDPGDPGRYLRAMGLVVATPDEDGAIQWQSAQRIEQLPTGIYFDPQRSRGDGTGAPLPTMQLELTKGGPQSAGNGQQWYYFELTAEGMATSSNGALFVLSPAKMSETGELIRPSDSAVRGFVLRQLGTLTSFDVADHLPHE